MAIFHLNCSVIGGKTGARQSAVAFAAYISGSVLTAEETHITYNFKGKLVTDSQVFLPERAPDKWLDRSVLWNEVERIEKPINGRLARIIDAAIPNELSIEDARQLMHDFAKYFTDQGMCCDMGLHCVPGNHHLHVMLTTRPLDHDGTFAKFKERKVYALDEEGKKIPLLDEEENQKLDKRGYPLYKRVRVLVNPWDSKDLVLDMRKEWERLCNSALEASGYEERIDRRSYAAQGIDRIPTKHDAIGRRIEANGGFSPICQENREIRKINSLRDMIDSLSAGVEQLKDKIEKVKVEAKQEYQDFLERFKSITGKVESIIFRNKDVDAEQKINDVDSQDVVKRDDDYVDRDSWHDPLE